jgi:hypothetical protein
MKLLLYCQAVLCIAALCIPFGIIKDSRVIAVILLLNLICSFLIALFVRKKQKSKTEE